MTTTKKAPEKDATPATTPDLTQMLRVLGIDEEKQRVLAEITTKQAQLDLARAELETKRNEANTQIAEINKGIEVLEGRVEVLETDLDDLRADMPILGTNGKAKAKNGKGVVSNEPGQGRKQCPQCHKYVGVRVGKCPNCGHAFPVSDKKSKPAPKGKKAAEGGRGRREEGTDLASMVVRVLSRNQNGLKLPDIAKKVVAAGYKTSSQNLVQAVYNVLGKLKREEKVEKDDAKRYKLTETAA